MSCDLAMSTFQQETSHLSDEYHHQYNNMLQAESSGESNLQHPDGNSGRKVSHEMQKPDPPAAAAAPPPLRPLVKVLACFAAIGGFLFGYDTGVVSGAMILLKKEFGLNTIWQEMIVSVTIGAAALSALFGGIFNEKLGRRKVILIASTVFTAGALMMGLTPNKELLLAGRLVVGIGVGLASMTVPMYIAEVAPVHARGRLVTLNNLFITGGQFVASVVDGAFSYWPWGWRAMLGLAGVPSAIQLIGFIFLPESPRWLIDHGQLEKAKMVLIRTSGMEHWEDQYQQIVQDAENTKRDYGDGSIFVRIFRTPPVLRALFVGCGLQMFQQLAGINTIMYYSATIIRMSGVKDDSTVIWLSAVVAFVNFIFTLAGVYLVEKVGRRVLTLSSFTGVAASVLFLAVAFLLIAESSPDIDVHSTDKCSIYSTCDACILTDDCGFCFQTLNKTIYNGTCLVADVLHGNQSLDGPCSQTHLLKHESEWAYDYCPSPYAFLSFIGLILYLVFFAPGMGPMPWTINSEIYPQWARSTGNAVASTVNWSFNLLIAMTFLSLTELITRQGAFFLYFGICVVGIIFIALFLPETKGTRLEDIQELFEKPLCCGPSSLRKANITDAHESESSRPLLSSDVEYK
ncbi:proton myo-inositol cotransporter [Strongylocentrotus purpuratus]|uniref:Major facilitator superfamily (MFS) profile domain-containing protein n=1 Tax=Strongylocentrotus purpuratus TaxID=7668 RepID=A0A7M7RHU1_STRPU|nr:proton myo-inositol cotransporter [Strongylocentrotus purpuratus]